MGLVSDIQSDLKEAFDDDLSDVVVGFTVHFPTSSGTYDNETDSMQVVNGDKPTRGVFGPVSNRKNGEEVKYTDEQLIIIANEVDGVPEIDVDFTTEHGDSYHFVEVLPVMGGGSTPAIYDCAVRKHR